MKQWVHLESEVDNMYFTAEQKQLLYAALMSYGNKLSDMAKEIPNETVITDMMTDKAKQSWDLAREIIKLKNEEEDDEDMSRRYPTKELSDFADILKNNGYREIRSNGSHFIFSNGKNTISANKDLNKMVRIRLIKENNLIER